MKVIAITLTCMILCLHTAQCFSHWNIELSRKTSVDRADHLSACQRAEKCNIVFVALFWLVFYCPFVFEQKKTLVASEGIRVSLQL